ncbi:MAG: peptidylprolyl isomerase [Rhodospirillaceae bacterium]
MSLPVDAFAQDVTGPLPRPEESTPLPERSTAPAAPAQDNSQTTPQTTMESLDLENTLYLDLEYGRVVIEMKPDMAPQHVARIKELVREGFYDGIVFHRVMDGFMAQTGDPKGDGTGGSGQNIPAEFNDGTHVRGAVSMARAANINSADSQFFIVLEDSDFLDGQYTYWGQVVSGMEFVDRIRKGDPTNNGAVPYPDRIIQLQIAADVEEANQ